MPGTFIKDHLGSMAVMTDTAGNTASSLSYFPYGSGRASTGTVPTEKEFTGQRLDGTGLYFYGARYYDAGLGIEDHRSRCCLG